MIHNPGERKDLREERKIWPVGEQRLTAEDEKMGLKCINLKNNVKKSDDAVFPYGHL